MSNLAKALSLWEKNGHSRTEFSERTGIDTGTVSRLFNGQRNLTKALRESIWNAFVATERDQALAFFIADVRDSLPAEVLEHLTLHIRERAVINDGRPLTDTEKAVRHIIEELQAGIPDTVNLALALWEWDQRNQQPRQ